MVKFMVKFVVLMLLLMGCAGLAKEEKNWMKFDQTSKAYLLALRWGEYEGAYGFRGHPNINDKKPDFQDLSDVRVTSYKVKQTIISENKMIVIQLVDFQYYRMRNVTVRTLTDHQKWKFDEEKEKWYLLSDLPHFE